MRGSFAALRTTSINYLFHQAVRKQDDQIKRYQAREYKIWRSSEMVLNLPAKGRRTGSLARCGSIHFFKRPIRRWFKALALRSSRVRGLRGTHIRSVRL